MNNQPVLFVHTRDGPSQKILETLKQMNKDTLCRIVAIDTVQRASLPPFLKSVPTLYVPDSKDVYVGKDIYAYIAKPVTARREVPVQQTGGGGGLTQGAPSAGGFTPWSFEGKGSLTESYSSWDAPGKFSQTDQLLYSFLDSATSALAPGPREPETKQSYEGQKAGRNDDISARMEQYKKMRETEFKGISRQ